MVQSVVNHQSCDEFHTVNVVKNFWKNFNILNSVTLVDESWKEVKESTLNACWRNVWPGIVQPQEKSVRQELTEVVRNIVDTARTIDGEGFSDLQEQEVDEIVLPSADLQTEEIEDIAASLPAEMPITEKEHEPQFDRKSILEIMNSLQNAVELALDRDPIMRRSLDFKHNCDRAMEIYRELYKDILRRAKQSRVTDFFSF